MNNIFKKRKKILQINNPIFLKKIIVRNRSNIYILPYVTTHRDSPVSVILFHTHTLSVLQLTLKGVLLPVEEKISQAFSKVGMTFLSDLIIDILLPTTSKAVSGQDVLGEGDKGVNSFPHLAV